jgi:hypothetical protein
MCAFDNYFLQIVLIKGVYRKIVNIIF